MVVVYEFNSLLRSHHYLEASIFIIKIIGTYMLCGNRGVQNVKLALFLTGPNQIIFIIII